MAKARRSSAPPPDRRTRREALRADRRAERQSARAAPPTPWWRSPVASITGLALVVGLVIVALVALQGGPPAEVVAPAPQVAVPAALAHDRALGDPNAPVTLDVWSDFQCPACHAFWTIVTPRLVTTYVTPGKVRIVYRDYVFIGPESTGAAVAARCANQEGPTDFWRFHDYLYANQGAENSGAFSRDRLEAIAKAMGLDGSAFARCLDDPSVSQAVTAETAEGRALGVRGTPTVFLGGKSLAGFDYPTVSHAIDAALGLTPSASPAVSSGTPSASSTPGP